MHSNQLAIEKYDLGLKQIKLRMLSLGNDRQEWNSGKLFHTFVASGKKLFWYFIVLEYIF